MITQMLQKNTSKGSCIIALQICLQSSIKEYNLGKMDKRQLILYSISRVKTLVQPFIQQIGGWKVLTTPKRTPLIDMTNLPDPTMWQQQIQSNHLSKMMVHIGRCKPIDKKIRRTPRNSDNENQSSTSQIIHTGNQEKTIQTVTPPQEPGSRYPLRGININIFSALTFICIIITYALSTKHLQISKFYRRMVQ